MRKLISLLFLLPLFISTACSDSASVEPPNIEADKPRLIVTVVVDQMRYNYLNRFQNEFEEDGFNKLRREGFSFANTHHDYFPTLTGAGHASIFTGANPSMHGIVANNWFDRKRDRKMYCVEDGSVQGVGASGSIGRRSPRNLLSSTFTDELKKVSPGSKVVTVSMKDRGAILPAGHLGDIALWYDDSQGDFISSTWYTQSLPDWAQKFNESARAETLCQKNWEFGTQVSQSSSSQTMSEGPECYRKLKRTPFGNTLLKELAAEAITEEKLGDDATTDVLNISFSATDYIGHTHGPQSMEVRDAFDKLDQDIADLITLLDNEVGEGQYLLVLTSDHGVSTVPGQQLDRPFPGGYFNSKSIRTALENHLDERYGDGNWIRNYSNQQIFLNRSLVHSRGLTVQEVQDESALFLEQEQDVASANTGHDFATEGYNSNSVRALYQKGFYPKRSGDIYIRLNPGWVEYNYKPGTSHGSVYDYDSHVPLIFYGWGAPAGSTTRKTGITQMAPTISHLIGAPYPNGTESNILSFN